MPNPAFENAFVAAAHDLGMKISFLRHSVLKLEHLPGQARGQTQEELGKKSAFSCFLAGEPWDDGCKGAPHWCCTYSGKCVLFTYLLTMQVNQAFRLIWFGLV